MLALRPILLKTRELPLINKLAPLFDAIDAALFGAGTTTAEAPHCVDAMDLKRLMSVVIIALLPCVGASVLFYGWRVLALIAVSYIAGGMVETAFAVVRKQDIHEGFFVTGLIFPLTLPPGLPLWIAAVGVVFGTLFGKEVFGGTGRNIFNPALVGRLFITIAFPVAMTVSWRAPFADAITSATPLAAYKTAQTLTPFADLLLGRTAGSAGETFRLGIIAGGIFLLITKVGDWRVPAAYLGSVFVLGGVGHRFFPGAVAPAVFQLFAGGLLFGAFFMATDPVTSPFTKGGKWIFGALCGFFTVLIRSFSGYAEGVMFSIVIMNALAPLIDHLVVKAKFRPVRAENKADADIAAERVRP